MHKRVFDYFKGKYTNASTYITKRGETLSFFLCHPYAVVISPNALSILGHWFIKHGSAKNSKALLCKACFIADLKSTDIENKGS